MIAVGGNRISHLGPAGAAMHPETPDDIVIDAAGKFILPGLIDAHCHISLHQGALPGAQNAADRMRRPQGAKLGTRCETRARQCA